MSNILVISDLHLKQELGYAEYLPDRRRVERQEILDFIVKSAEGCDDVVLLGDSLNGRNNMSSVTKEFVEFLERFDGKNVHILAGNHELSADGQSAIDFLKEVHGKKWHIVTNAVEKVDNWTFAPYFYKAQLGKNDNAEASKILMDQLGKNDILFCHQTISGTLTTGGLTDTFNEIILDGTELQKRFTKVFAGHIHSAQRIKNLIIAGSVFSETAGEHDKKCYIVTNKGGKVTELALPGRGIGMIRDPNIADLYDAPKHHIVKCILEKNHDEEYFEKLRAELAKFDAHILISQIPKERKTYEVSDGKNLLELDLGDLLEIYAKNNKKDIKLLKRGMELLL